MKISLKWLDEFISVEDFFSEPQALASRLTQVGFEVEEVKDLSVSYQNVVIGLIRERGQHPNADRLTLCQVEVGGGKVHQIVCGAKNHKAGDHVVVALPGAVLPGDFKIQLSKIRDVESQGMLCSEKELGLSTESEGIMILPSSAKVGESFAAYAGKDDIILDISVSPNRADVLSHFGVARELSVVLGRPLKELKLKGQLPSKPAKVDLTVEEAALCPRYLGVSLKNIKVGPSPLWLKNRLESVDVNSVNNVVDIGNFVMMEWGQPLHAFDAKKLLGAQVRVGLSKTGEKFTSFDGTEFELTGTELMIRDREHPMVIAGTIGSSDSGISNETTEVFLEAAYFVPETVRKTSRKLGIETDSAYRFSRGTDPEMIPRAALRASQLLVEVCGAEILGATDFYPTPTSVSAFEIRPSLVGERVGYPVSNAEFQSVLKKLNCEVKEQKDLWFVTPPAYRADLKEDVDLVEEFARLNGYDKVPEAFPPLISEPTDHDPHSQNDLRLRQLVAGEGFHQAINYGFLNAKVQSEILGAREIWKGLGLEMWEGVPLRNPLNEELSSMRQSLLPGLLKNTVHNLRYGVHSGRLFELGSVFFRREKDYHERFQMAFSAFGCNEGLWANGSVTPVFELKATLENIFMRLNIGRVQWKPLKPVEVPICFHPGQTVALVVEGRPIGVLGTLHPALCEREKIAVPIAVAELDAGALMRGQPRLPKLKTLSAFPAVERDLTFLVPKALQAAEVEKVIAKASGALLQSVEVISQFVGGHVPEGFRSLSFRMIFQDLDKTLSEEVLQDLQARIIDQVQKSLGVAMR